MILYQVIQVYQDDIVGTEVTVKCSSFNKEIIDNYIISNSLQPNDIPYHISEIDIPNFEDISIHIVIGVGEDDYGDEVYSSPKYITFDKKDAEIKVKELEKYYGYLYKIDTYPIDKPINS